MDGDCFSRIGIRLPSSSIATDTLCELSSLSRPSVGTSHSVSAAFRLGFMRAIVPEHFAGDERRLAPSVLNTGCSITMRLTTSLASAKSRSDVRIGEVSPFKFGRSRRGRLKT